MPAVPVSPARGEIWLADLDPVIGHEQAGRRPVLVVSVDHYNQSRADLAVVLPVTSTIRQLPFHITVAPPEGGLTNASCILCDGLRSISKQRFVRCWGRVSSATLAAVDERLRILLNL